MVGNCGVAATLLGVSLVPGVLCPLGVHWRVAPPRGVELHPSPPESEALSDDICGGGFLLLPARSFALRGPPFPRGKCLRRSEQALLISCSVTSLSKPPLYTMSVIKEKALIKIKFKLDGMCIYLYIHSFTTPIVLSIVRHSIINRHI